MYYIHAIASITHQNTFRVNNIMEELAPLDIESTLISPNYKEFIPGAALRRLSPVLRIGLTTSIECKNKVGKDFDAISVGTALGCLKDTEKFLNTFLTSTSDFLSPTAFIQSTHNTIGGQISLGLGNHAYNMTHTQNNVSFEVALLDGMMCINEGKENVLVGAADENIKFLELIQPSLISDKYPLSTGGSFFAFSNNKSAIGVKAVQVNFNSKNTENELNAFLKENNLSKNQIDVILHSNSAISTLENQENIDYLQYSGLHYSASSFALHIAHDNLKYSDKKTAIIVNDMCAGKTGFMLLIKDEA
ncbi:MAG: beta-ketoacyl synthase chain length factor [Crocinitomicaceae bacterium]|nr:beta-ketoacyl synthase chain length factor [Crocinitomicaceae bacterium]